jgi:DNA-binding IclR family transcriptional regulator
MQGILMTDLPAQPVKGLMDGIAVLQEIAVHREPSSVSEVGRMLGIEKTRVHRVLRTLAHLGIVHRTGGGRYGPGPGMHVLAAQSLYSSGLIQRALRHLAVLGESGLTVGFGVLWHGTVSFLYHQGPGLTPFESIGRVGLFEATRSSVGLMLLSRNTDRELKRMYSGKDIAGFSSFTAFMKEIRGTRSRGYACISRADGHRSIAVTVGTPVYAGIAMAGQIADPEIADTVSTLRETAERIEYE